MAELSAPWEGRYARSKATGCDGKTEYLSPKAAKLVADQMSRRCRHGVKPPNIYRCRHCGKWHVGRKTQL
jgi:hypothetical protein